VSNNFPITEPATSPGAEPTPSVLIGTFKPAPPSSTALVWTIGFFAIFLFFLGRVILGIAGTIYSDLLDLGATVILAGAIIYGWARSVKRYKVSKGDLFVERMLIKGVSIPLDMMVSVKAEPDIGSFFNMSMLGSGGLFGWGGRARVRKTMDVNAMEAYVYGSNPKYTILFKMEGGQNIIVTPADTKGFLEAIRGAEVKPQPLALTAQMREPGAPKKKRKH